MGNSNLLKLLFGEAIETIAECAVMAGVDELQDKINDGIVDEFIKDILDDLVKDRDDPLGLYGGVIAAAVKPLLEEAVRQGANKLIEYLWEQVQKINKYDETSEPPTLV